MTDPRLSIRRTLLRHLGSLFVVSTALLIAATYSYGRAAADASYDRLLNSSALAIAENVGRVRGLYTVDLPYAALELLAMAPDDRVFYRVSDPQGRTILGDRGLPWPRPVAGERQPPPFDAEYGGEAVRFVVRRRWIGDATGSGWLAVQVGQTRRARDSLARDILWSATLPIAALGLGALLLVRIAVRRALRPVARMEQALLDRKPSDLSPFEQAVPIELTQLISALNRFIARLSHYTKALERLIELTGHQLRTRASAVLSQAQEGLDAGDPRGQSESLRRIEENAVLLWRLIDQLRSHAKVAHHADLRSFEGVDLAEIAREAALATLPRAEPRPELRFDVHGDTRVHGNRFMLGEAVKNLIHNALRYGCPERAPLELRVRGEAERCVLTLFDRGPGLDVEDLERVLQPYQRGPETRPDGDGLGLAIVSNVVDSHGGRLSLANREGGGLEVRIELPRIGA